MENETTVLWRTVVLEALTALGGGAEPLERIYSKVLALRNERGLRSPTHWRDITRRVLQDCRPLTVNVELGVWALATKPSEKSAGTLV